MFEGIAKTNTTHTVIHQISNHVLFEGIAKTNTTHTYGQEEKDDYLFEGIAKTNTTHTLVHYNSKNAGLRVLLKQIQHTHSLRGASE